MVVFVYGLFTYFYRSGIAYLLIEYVGDFIRTLSVGIVVALVILILPFLFYRNFGYRSDIFVGYGEGFVNSVAILVFALNLGFVSRYSFFNNFPNKGLVGVVMFRKICPIYC